VHRADHIVEPREVCSPENPENHGAEEGANEALKRLFWGELDERGAADGDTPQIGKDIVTYDERCGDPEPDEAFKNIVHNKVTDIRSLSSSINRLNVRSYLETTMRSKLI
jgi:hypothetical protein